MRALLRSPAPDAQQVGMWPDSFHIDRVWQILLHANPLCCLQVCVSKFMSYHDRQYNMVRKCRQL